VYEEGIDNRKYCIKVSREGAAGSVYKKYNYATLIENRLIVLDFTIQYTQCANYPQPKRSECKQERENFDPDNLVDYLIKNAEFK
jgi:hypothetical protein